MSYLSRGKIGKTGKYRGNGKTKKKQKIEESLFLQISTLSKKKKKMSGLYQTRERLALYPSEATTIFRLLAARGFFDTTSSGEVADGVPARKISFCDCTCQN